jgi:hypothetical protein
VKRSEHLRGPWLATLSDRAGFVYDSVADARGNADDPDDEFSVSIVRGTAMPDDRSGCRLRMPGSYSAGDQIFDLDDLYLDDDGDESVTAGARFAQAQAMAAGLNAAGGAE